MRTSVTISLAVLFVHFAYIDAQVIELYPNGTINAVHGQGLNVTCYSDGGINGTSLEWFIGRNSITKYGNNRMYTNEIPSRGGDLLMLTFNPIYEMDSSRYECCVTSNSYRLLCEGVIINVMSNDVNATIGYPPRFHIDFVSYEFVEGDDVYLECSADGVPPPEYIWLDTNGRDMRHGGNWNVSSKGWLKIPSIKRSQEGTYTCVAVNYYGNASKLYIVNVSRGISPWFRQSIEYYEFSVGSDVKLKCQAEGRPTPTYEWYDKYGINMNYRRGNWDASTDGTLEIYSIEYFQSGNYSCVATNVYGNASKEYEIKIRGGTAPWFRQSFEHYTFPAGSNIRLKCEAEGRPIPNYEWYDKYGRIMNYSGENWRIPSDGILELYSIEEDQSGSYICVATNIHGNASKEYKITVKDDFRLNVVVRELWQTVVRFNVSIEGRNTTYRYLAVKFRSITPQSYNWSQATWSIGDEYIITGLTPGRIYKFIFGLKERSYITETDWIEDSELTLTFPPFSPLLIVNEMNKGTVKIEFPYQTFNELNGSLKPLYFNLRYVKLRQKSGTYYEENCGINIDIPACFGRGYTIAGLVPGSYYKIELYSMLQSGPSAKSETIVRIV